MVVFSKNPQIAERQMQAVIVYLTTFGWIDGDFDLSEKLFVLEYIRSLVEMRVSQAGIDDPMLRLETINRYTTHFDMEFERVDTEIRSWFDEVVAGDENQTKFVHARMKLRCFELFKQFDESNQRDLLEAASKLIAADGVEHPNEIRFRQELAALLGAEVPVPVVDEDVPAAKAPPPLQVAPPIVPPPRMENHPILEHMEKHYSRDPAMLYEQMKDDHELLSQAIVLWNEARAQGDGRLASKTQIAQLTGSFLDGHVYVLVPEPGKAYELIVLGDMHGCYSCLKGALLQADFFRKVQAYRKDPASNPMVKLVLLGDYIDRGYFSFNGILRTIMQLYVSMPEHVVILRGNHEYFLEVNGRVFGGVRPAEAIATMSPYMPVQMLEAYMMLFESMPNMMFFDRTLFVHAGIPRDETIEAKYRDLSSLNDSELRFEMLWSDPSQANHVPRELQRENARFPFGKQQFRAFMHKIGANALIRGHEKINEGYRPIYTEPDMALLNLFSAGGKNNRDLPPDSSYRQVTPMALTIGHKDGVQTATPWLIDYESFNSPDRNGFFKVAPEIEFRAS
ncbi:MAG TPA: metallophosphoesterase family protein [Haliangiales bacterium]|nr:metallophosphoesterase family protein [Haliangiales bacterium]